MIDKRDFTEKFKQGINDTITLNRIMRHVETKVDEALNHLINIANTSPSQYLDLLYSYASSIESYYINDKKEAIPENFGKVINDLKYSDKLIMKNLLESFSVNIKIKDNYDLLKICKFIKDKYGYDSEKIASDAICVRLCSPEELYLSILFPNR